MPHGITRTFAALATAALLFSVVPSAAGAAVSRGGAPVSPGSGVIVQVSDASHMNAVRAQLEKDGATVRKTYRWNAYLVSPPADTGKTQFADQAQDISGVKTAQGDYVVHALGAAPNDPLYPQQWGLPDIGAPAAWASSLGTGVAVAEIDTGVDAAQPDLAGQVVPYWNYVAGNADTDDDNGHGTHVAGIIAALQNNGFEVSGTAPQAKIYAFKVLDASGNGSDSDVAQAIRDAADVPCRIISMSLGGTAGAGGDPVLASAVAYAQSKGSLVIAAAGNGDSSGNGVTTPEYPAAVPGVIGVGAVDSNNTRAVWSNYGATDLDLMAPGVNIYSTWPWTNLVSKVPGPTAQILSGTSMATPFVSASAALVWAAHPSLTAAQVTTVLENTAQDLGAAGVDQFYRYGLVRPDLALATLAAPPAPVPTSTPVPTPTPLPSPSPTPPATTTLTLTMSSTTVVLHHVRTLRGVLKPGALSDTVKIYRILPGGTTWMLLATVHMSSLNSSGGAVWSHAYKPQKRGTYKIRVKFLGTSARKASTSPTVKLRVN